MLLAIVFAQVQSIFLTLVICCFPLHQYLLQKLLHNVCALFSVAVPISHDKVGD